MYKCFIMPIDGIDVSDPQIMRELPLLRREKISALAADEAKRRSIGAGMLLNKAVILLHPEAKIPLGYEVSQTGKPYLSDYPHTYFSLSHSDEYCACVVSDRPCGCDIQHLRMSGREDAVAERFFCGDEKRAFAAAADKKRVFGMLWTRKESFLKANGDMSVRLDSFSVIADECTFSGAKYLFKEESGAFPPAEYMFTVCIAEKEI